MSIAYVDTSVLTAIAFDEPGAAALARQLDEFARLISSNMLEAELRAALRPFFACFGRRGVRKAGYVSPRSGGLTFATLDARQSAIAKVLGFPVPYEGRLS